MSVNVKKKLILFFVFYPSAGVGPEAASLLTKGGPSSSCIDVSDISILELVEVDEFVVTRWLPGSAPTG